MNKNGKRVVQIVTSLIILAVVGAKTVLPKPVAVENPQLPLISTQDGSYRGSCENGLVGATVVVEVANHTITGITLEEHRNGKGAPAEAVLQQVLDKQTLQVDTISGATYSSLTIIKAIENAIPKQ